MTYDFTYTDNEGDEFQSNDHPSLSAAKAEVRRLDKLYDGDFRIIESWIYREDGSYKGSWH